MNNLDKLIEKFEKFPGVGARQAKRFAFHILRLNEKDTEDLAKLIESLKTNTKSCQSCQRFFSVNVVNDNYLCNICSDGNRDHSKLLVVASDNDITPIERSGIYDGLYFVLGGTAPLLESTSSSLRTKTLTAIIEERLKRDLSEIILAFAVNPDGENTDRYIISVIEPIIKNSAVIISHLGRGLSTGSELEYADPETIKNALVNRH